MTVDLTTSYLGLDLANPLLASPSPLTEDLTALRRLEDAGVAAVVLPSLFEEEIEHEAAELQRLAAHGHDAFAEAIGGYLPGTVDVETTPERYLRTLEAAKAQLQIPVLASLNGTSTGGWTTHAARLEAAGADALELNVYLIPTDPSIDGHAVEERYVELVRAVRAAVAIPLAVKIGPYFSSPAAMARKLEVAGADGLVVFNRFYQPDIDLDELRVVPGIVLSSPHELRLPLRWVAILSEQLGCDLAVTSGVYSGLDVIKALLVGADVAMMTSALLRHGPGYVKVVLTQLQDWLAEHGYTSVGQARGAMSLRAAADPEAYVRANYLQTLRSYSAPLG